MRITETEIEAESVSFANFIDQQPVFQPSRVNGSRPAAASGERTATLPGHAVVRAMETPVLRGLLPLVAGFSPNAHGQVRQPELRSGEAVLLYCGKGEGWCEIRGRRYRVSAEDLLVIPAESARIYGSDSHWTFAWVHATGANLEFFLNQLGVTSERPVLKVGDDSRLLGWFLELIDTLGSDCPPARLLYASQTLAHLLSALICRQRETRSGDVSTGDKIQRSIAYMKQHLSEPLRAATLASVATMSLPHYFALFKQRIGSTPIDYFIKLRMEQARHLLAETTWSIKEVAAVLGYEDPLYFSRVFKSVTRATPSDYRQKERVVPALPKGRLAGRVL
jgi:AraC-like DNA-binding protein